MNIIEHWGFKYINVFLVWKKTKENGDTRKGMGYYSRGVYEYLLLGSIGTTNFLRKP